MQPTESTKSKTILCDFTTNSADLAEQLLACYPGPIFEHGIHQSKRFGRYRFDGLFTDVLIPFLDTLPSKLIGRYEIYSARGRFIYGRDGEEIYFPV